MPALWSYDGCKVACRSKDVALALFFQKKRQKCAPITLKIAHPPPVELLQLSRPETMELWSLMVLLP